MKGGVYFSSHPVTHQDKQLKGLHHIKCVAQSFFNSQAFELEGAYRSGKAYKYLYVLAAWACSATW